MRTAFLLAFVAYVAVVAWGFATVEAVELQGASLLSQAETSNR